MVVKTFRTCLSVGIMKHICDAIGTLNRKKKGCHRRGALVLVHGRGWTDSNGDGHVTLTWEPASKWQRRTLHVFDHSKLEKLIVTKARAPVEWHDF